MALLASVLVASTASGVRGSQSPPQDPSAGAAVSAEKAFLGRYCTSCHSSTLKTPAGALALSESDLDNVGAHAATWEKVVRKLRARAMPPPAPGRARPDEAAYEGLVSYLETSLDRAAAGEVNPGRTETFHRLNRTEYRNAIRDLLALDVEVDALLPTDNASHGFDNVNVSGLSPTLVEQYLSAARKISRLAVGTPPRSPEARTVVLPLDRTQDYHVEGLPHGTRGGTMFSHNFPVDGEYRVSNPAVAQPRRTGRGLQPTARYRALS